jgi:hypothetical protein
MIIIIARMKTVMSKGNFIDNTKYIGKMVRHNCAMIPRTTLNISSLNLLLGTKEGSSRTTILCIGFQKPHGRTVL